MGFLKDGAHKVAVAGVCLLASAGIAWASCGGTEVLVSAAVTSMAATVSASVTAMATAVVTQDQYNANSIVSAIRVMTKQKAVSSDKASQAMIQGGTAQAVFASELADKELVDKMVLDFTSQGFDPCGQSTATKNMAAAENGVRSSVSKRVLSEVEGVGGRYASKLASLISREKQHNEMFCTQSEKDAGICSSVGRLPGGDTNAALLFNTDSSPDAVAARSALINTIVGLPDEPLPVEAQKTAEGQAYYLEKKKKDAFMAWAANSLKSIQAESEGLKSSLDERVGQYFGTPRAAQWAASQATQSTRGVLVDLVKIQGITLKARERAIRENLRLETNFAAMLELENQSTNGVATQRAASQITADSGYKKVKP
jgi:hypothetical protein